MTDRIDTDATVEQIRAFADMLPPDVGPCFGQDVVALCDEVDRLRARLTLTEDEQSTVMRIGEKHNWPGGYMQHDFADLLAIIDRLSPGVAEPPTPCRHSIYHSGCSSCDRQDPEDRE